jgi:hypothetical protein
VVEFVLKPAYKSSSTLDAKLEKFPIRRKSNLAQESDAESSEDSGEESGEENDRHEENVDPSWMDDEDIFMEDHDVFVSLGLRAEDEATRLRAKDDGFEDATDAEITVDDEAENEPKFAIDKENTKIRKGETFPCMKEFRMALKHYAILNQFAVHKVVTNKKRYKAQCKANGCPWRIVAKCKQTCGPANCRGMYLVPKYISLPYNCFSYLNVTFFSDFVDSS